MYYSKIRIVDKKFRQIFFFIISKKKHKTIVKVLKITKSIKLKKNYYR